MTPAPAAAARNIKNAVEGDEMTDEELEQEIQRLSEDIDRISKAEADSLTKKEKRLKHVLPIQKEILQKMKHARERKDRSAEMKYSMDYAVLETFGDKHPLLLHFARTKLRWTPF
jgi:ribosome-binding protein aMBF1 (putative translation factor)